MSGEQRESGIGNRKGGGRIVLVLAALILPGAVYLSFHQAEPPAKLASLPAPSKPAQPRDAEGRLQPAPSFDAVTADDDGMLFAAGKGPAGWSIVLQNAAQTLGNVHANSDGEWLLMLGRPLEPGDYVLSLLAQDPSGQASIAGKRTFALTVAPRRKPAAAPSRQIAAAPSTAAAEVRQAAAAEAAKTAKVKRGDSLWSIAQHHLGSGERYREIFGANKSQIKDPNLIYPEQQFAVPH
jgi:nucleoid-associated protein YgaU